MPDWLSGFGVQANATYIDAKAEFPLFRRRTSTGTAARDGPGPEPCARRLRIPDVSKWTYNLVGMYEGGGLTLRLAYNHRSGFPEGALVRAAAISTRCRAGAIGVSRLDWSSSYAFNDNLTVFFDWTNILGKPFRSDIVRVNYRGRQPDAAPRYSRCSCASRNR